MKITLKNLPEQVELIKAMGSKDTLKARQAQETFAALLAPTIGEVYRQADTTSMIFRDITFNENEDPSFPLELFGKVREGHFTIWSQTMPGGLPTNTVHQPIEEVKFTTYRLDSAISYLRKYARKARLDVVGKAIERLLQEILLKTNRQAWSVVLAALANASHGGVQHVFRTGTAGTFTLDDLNNLFTRIRRLNTSWAGGTPEVDRGQLTDLVISPEVKGMIREFAYNPINVKGANQTAGTASSGVIALPEGERARMFAGTQSLFDVALTELLELGESQRYNTLFDEFAGSTTYTKFDGSGSAAFAGASEQIVLGFDLSQDFAYRAIETSEEDNKSVFSLIPDDQFLVRSDKIGFYGWITEGRLVLETRPMTGLIV